LERLCPAAPAEDDERLESDPDPRLVLVSVACAFVLVLGILGLILLRQFGISRERWLAQVLIASSLLVYLGPIVFDNTVGRIGIFEITEQILFVSMILSGVLMLGDQKAV
jgi:hypothetical protein